MLEKLINIVAPHHCIGCGAEGSLLCAWCIPDACQLLPERCYRCQRQTRDSRVCPDCRRTSNLRHVWVRCEYDGLPKQLVHALKFERAKSAAVPVAQLLRESLPYLPPETMITWVPTATRRYRERGYDQAALIAKALAAELNLRTAPLLARLGQTRQVGAKREQRLQQLQSAFRIRNNHLLAGHSVLLIDDIVTTGATLEAAARILKENGAKSVDAAVFASKK